MLMTIGAMASELLIPVMSAASVFCFSQKIRLCASLLNLSVAALVTFVGVIISLFEWFRTYDSMRCDLTGLSLLGSFS